MSKLKYKCTFQDSWLVDKKYKKWIQKVVDIYSARCKVCDKNISISGQGHGQLDSHAKGEKHKLKVPKDDSNSILLLVKPTASSNLEGTMGPKPTTIYFPHQKELATKAEIMWAIDVIMSKYSYSSSANKNDLFCTMFPDSDVAKNFANSDGTI